MEHMPLHAAPVASNAVPTWSGLAVAGAAFVAFIVGTQLVTSAAPTSSMMWSTSPVSVVSQSSIPPTTVSHRSWAPSTLSQTQRLVRETTSIPASAQREATMEAAWPQASSSVVPAGPAPTALWAGALLLVGVGAAVYAGDRAPQTTQPAELAMVAISGGKTGRFDPLDLASGTELPLRSEVTHGKLALGVILGSVVGAAVAAAPALAETDLVLGSSGNDFGFNYDFNVQFEGMTVDHRVLVDSIVLGQLIGFIGATVSGVDAFKRKQDIESLTDKLIAVNQQLISQQKRRRRQTPRAEPEAEPEAPEVLAIIKALRGGKALLKAGKPADALTTFQDILKMINTTTGLKDPVKAKRRTYRGIAAAYMDMENYKEALPAMLQVLSLSAECGDMEAANEEYAVVADVYTELGELVKAGEYYDRYLQGATD